MEKEILPQGDMIRQLLTSGNVGTSNINSLLREKGVFLGNYDKDISVPLLMKTIVSPNDFKELYETQKAKEDTIKFRTATIKIKEDIQLQDVFSEKFNLAEKITEAHKYKPNFKVIGDPQFYFEEEKAICEYKIERTNLLEDWTNNKTVHNGAVYITKSKEGDLELSVEQNSTSKETILLNEIINKEVKTILKKRDIIKSDDDFIRIRFNDFNNSNRIQFLYSFAKQFCVYLDFKSITDIDLYLDESQDSHVDVKKFLDEIDSLKLNGKGLQNHILLKNSLYHDKLIFASISLKYSFNIEGIKGGCVIIISFPDYISKKALNAELQISLNFTIDREHKKKATETQLRKKLYSFVEKQKVSNYKIYKTP